MPALKPRPVLLASALLLVASSPARADFDLGASLRAREAEAQSSGESARSARNYEARDRMIADIRRHTEELRLRHDPRPADIQQFRWRRQLHERAHDLRQRLDRAALLRDPASAAQSYRLDRDGRRALDGEQARRRLVTIEHERSRRADAARGDPGASRFGHR